LIQAARNRAERRVLILAPTVKDGQVSSAVLRGVGIESMVCDTAQTLADELNRGAGAVLIAEEALSGDPQSHLKSMLERQLPWSDLPLIVLTRPGADSTGVLETTAGLGNVTLLERPVRISALVSAVRTALRARSRQYQIRAHLRDREVAAEALKDADRRKDEFLAILAHELRNPLAPIRNALAIMKLAGADAVATQGLAEMLERQVDHMVRLVDDLFEVSRITRGMIELRKQRIDAGLVLRDVVASSRSMLYAAQQALNIDVASEPLPIDGDPVRLAQVFGNLLNNASKFSNEGGSLWLTARRRGDDVEISLKDEGKGIPREMLPRIFDMFTQVDRRASRTQSGLGIGLTLVKSLVELHGGAVHARSSGPGKGSEFVVHLPLAKEITVTREEPVSRSFPTGAVIPRRVLVVDDNRDSADSIAMLLKLLGADVHVVYDGPGALQAIDAFHPSVVLLDIGLPSMDGYEVARRIRQRPELNTLTLIALTGWGQMEDRARSREAGFQHHLVKPADPTVLQSLLETPHVA
jgi:signal transduction histidine kinase